jgi:excisionase family DNA binding protein
MTSDDAPDLSPKQAATRLGVSETTVKRLLRAGYLPGYRVGGKLWRTRVVWLDRFRTASATRAR